MDYWVCHEFPDQFETIEDLIDEVLKHLIRSPIHFVIEMTSLRFFDYPIPLRMLQNREMSLLFEVLLAYHKEEQRLFLSHVGIQGFKLCYDHYRYDSYLSERVDRVAFVQAFVCSLLQVVPDATPRLHQEIIQLCREAIETHALKDHPLKKTMLENVAGQIQSKKKSI